MSYTDHSAQRHFKSNTPTNLWFESAYLITVVTSVGGNALQVTRVT